jgi:hypothetical protein
LLFKRLNIFSFLTGPDYLKILAGRVGPDFLKMLPGRIGPDLLAKNIGRPDWAFYKFFRAGLAHLKLFAGRAGLSKNVTGLDQAVK